MSSIAQTIKTHLLSFEAVKIIVLLALPIILASVTIGFQIKNAGSLTGRELVLVNVMQFISSVWFGWVFALAFSEKEFQKRQKKFAESAFRRIKEIEFSVARLSERVSNNSRKAISLGDVEAVREIALNLKVTVDASKADWAEVIGKEIKALEEIEKIEIDQQVPDSGVSKKIQHLINQLSPSLKVQARESLNHRMRFERERYKLEEEVSKGYIEFLGFWDESFDKDIFSVPLNTTVFISVDDVGRRIGALIAHNKDGKSLGIILNKFGVSYNDFIKIVMEVFNKSKFEGLYFKKDDISKSSEGERHYFWVRVKKPKETLLTSN